MELIIWNSLIVLSKVAFYTGFALLFAVFFLRTHRESKIHDPQWRDINERILSVGRGAAIGNVFAILVGFLASTGAMAEEGISGMVDPFILEMMWNSPVGETTFTRTLGVIAALFLLSVAKKAEKGMGKRLWNAIYLSVLGFFAFTFTLSGHVAELNAYARAMIAVHVIVMAWWFGALLPLKIISGRFDPGVQHNILRRFGMQASVMVAFLSGAGVFLAFKLIASWQSLVSSSYGQILIVKLVMVVLILALAFYHKFRLVPSLVDSASNKNKISKRLSKSIGIEMGVAICILMITACLTSLVGPEG